MSLPKQLQWFPFSGPHHICLSWPHLSLQPAPIFNLYWLPVLISFCSPYAGSLPSPIRSFSQSSPPSHHTHTHWIFKISPLLSRLLYSARLIFSPSLPSPLLLTRATCPNLCFPVLPADANLVPSTFSTGWAQQTDRCHAFSSGT